MTHFFTRTHDLRNWILEDSLCVRLTFHGACLMGSKSSVLWFAMFVRSSNEFLVTEYCHHDAKYNPTSHYQKAHHKITIRALDDSEEAKV